MMSLSSFIPLSSPSIHPQHYQRLGLVHRVNLYAIIIIKDFSEYYLVRSKQQVQLTWFGVHGQSADE